MAYNKFYQFVEDLAHKVHNLGSDQLIVALTNVAPVATNEVLADLTEVSYTYCSSRNITLTSSGQTTGTYQLKLTDLTLTASGGIVGPFRYVVILNNTPTSPLKPLICWDDKGSSVTLADGESILIDFSDANGLFSIT